MTKHIDKAKLKAGCWSARHESKGWGFITRYRISPLLEGLERVYLPMPCFLTKDESLAVGNKTHSARSHERHEREGVGEEWQDV